MSLQPFSMKPAEKNRLLMMFDTVWFLYSPSIRSVHAGSSGAYLYQSGQQTMNRNRFREEKYSRSKQAEDARLYRPEQKQCLFLLFSLLRHAPKPCSHNANGKKSCRNSNSKMPKHDAVRDGKNNSRHVTCFSSGGCIRPWSRRTRGCRGGEAAAAAAVAAVLLRRWPDRRLASSACLRRSGPAGACSRVSSGGGGACTGAWSERGPPSAPWFPQATKLGGSGSRFFPVLETQYGRRNLCAPSGVTEYLEQVYP